MYFITLLLGGVNCIANGLESFMLSWKLLSTSRFDERNRVVIVQSKLLVFRDFQVSWLILQHPSISTSGIFMTCMWVILHAETTYAWRSGLQITSGSLVMRRHRIDDSSSTNNGSKFIAGPHYLWTPKQPNNVVIYSASGDKQCIFEVANRVTPYEIAAYHQSR